MVDSVGGVGSQQDIQQIKEKSAERRAEKAERTEEQSKAIEDKVEISQKAQELMSAKEAREEAIVVRQQLQADQSRSLGLDPNFDAEKTA